MKRIIYFFWVFLLSGCVTNENAPTFSEVLEPNINSNYAVLYIYRDYAEPTAWKAYFHVDGVQAAALNQQGFTWVYVSPGDHDLKYSWPLLSGMPNVNFKYTFEPGKVYAFEMEGVSGTRLATSRIQPLKIEIAKEHMQICCRYVKNKFKP